MTVKELFRESYKNKMKSISEFGFKCYQRQADNLKMSVSDTMLLDVCVNVTDIRNNNLFAEVSELNSKKIIKKYEKSHCETRYYLTKKGLKWVNE